MFDFLAKVASAPLKLASAALAPLEDFDCLGVGGSMQDQAEALQALIESLGDDE